VLETTSSPSANTIITQAERKAIFMCRIFLLRVKRGLRLQASAKTEELKSGTEL
jgi:hypothetical protein